jgi:hypothetical protein
LTQPRTASLLTKAISAKDGNFTKEVDYAKDGNLAVDSNFAKESNFAKAETLAQRATLPGMAYLLSPQKATLLKVGNFANKGCHCQGWRHC